MKPDKIVRFLEAVGVTNAQKFKRNGWVISRCPLGPWKHENGVSGPEVFGVRLDNGDPFCRCFACNHHGSLGGLVQTIAKLKKDHPVDGLDLATAQQLVYEAEETAELDFDIPGIEEVLARKRNQFTEFPAWWLETFPSAWDAPFARSYLHKRGVSRALAGRLDLRADPNQQRVCFPVRDFQGRLMGLHGRAIDGDTEPRYRMYTYTKKNNPIVWLGESWIDTNHPIVVVEGPFDMTSVMRVYDNICSPLFATPSLEKLRRMSDALEWVTIFDRGAGGDQGRQRMTEALGKDHLIHHLQPPKGRKDPGEMTVPELVHLLSPIVPLTALFS